MIKMTTKFENVRIGNYGRYETLETHDKCLCEEVGEEYQPSELTKDIQKLVKNNKIPTNFDTLVKLAKIIDNYDYCLIIEPDGTLLLNDCCY